MSGPLGPETDEPEISVVPLGPVIDVSFCGIGLTAIRYSIERPPRYVFLLENAQSDWVNSWVH